MLGRDYCDANRDHDWRREDDNGNIVDNVVYHWYRGSGTSRRSVDDVVRRRSGVRPVLPDRIQIPPPRAIPYNRLRFQLLVAEPSHARRVQMRADGSMLINGPRGLGSVHDDHAKMMLDVNPN